MLDKIKREAVQGRALLRFVALKATGQALTMLVPLIIAGFFSPDIFGSYSLAKMLVFLFMSLFISSTQIPFVVYAGREQASTGKINRTFTIQCMFFVISIILFLAIVFTFSEHIMLFAQISKVNLFFVCLAFIGISIKVFLSNLFLATDQKTIHSLVELIFGLCSVVLILVFHLFSWVNLNSVFLVYFLPAIFVTVSFVKYIEFRKLLPMVWDKKCFLDNLNFTKWVILGAGSVYFINWGDNFVLRYFVSMDEIGIYNFAYQIFKGIVILNSVFVHYFMPFISKNIGNKKSMKAYVYSKRPKTFLLALVPACILLIFVPYVVKMVYGGIYDDSIAVFRILWIGSVLALYSAFYSPVFYALERYKFSQSTDVVQAFGNVVLNLILVPRMGLYGAAVATVIAYFCRTVIYEVYFRRRIKKLFEI